MCGIAGYTGPLKPDVLENFNRQMRHRGPDDEGIHHSSWAHICMRRLSIVDIEGGKQPMFNHDRSIAIVFNGEIYNSVELRDELATEGTHFQTDRSDTEILVHLYERMGIDFVNRLNGMFAICIVDESRQSLFLIRDRVGEKPIYTHIDPISGQLTFASEFNLLRLPQRSENIDRASLQWFLGQKAMPDGSTIDTRIARVPAGHFLRFDRDGVHETTSYYQVARSRSRVKDTETKILQDYEEILQDATRLRLNADVEVGSFLSGGIDSSLVTAFAARSSSTPLKTYCLVYDEDIYHKSADRAFAQQVSEIFGTNHHEVLITADLFLQELPKIVRQFGQPNSAVFSNWFISREMSRVVKVALSGDGADELMGSYRPHRLAAGLAEMASGNTQEDGMFFTADDIEFIDRHRNTPEHEVVDLLSVFPSAEQTRLLQPHALHSSTYLEILRNKHDNLLSTEPLDRALEFDFNGLLIDQILNYVDTLGMAHSLEIRVPFLDPRLVEYAFSLDARHKIRGGITKFLLRHVAARHLPRELIDRPKEGFVEPNIYWLQRDLKTFCRDQLLSDRFDIFGIFRKSYVHDLTNEFFRSADFAIGKKVWNLLMYSLWEQQYAE